MDLINNTDGDIYNEVINNMNKKYKNKNLEIKTYESGTKIRLKPGCYKIGRNIKFRKNKNKFISIPATIVKDYECGMLFINIDASYYEFKINEKFYIDSTLIVILKNNQWKTLVNICNKHYKDEEDQDIKKNELDQKDNNEK